MIKCEWPSLKELIEYSRDLSPYVDKYNSAEKYFDKLRALKELYFGFVLPRNTTGKCRKLPHDIDIARIFNHVEYFVHCDMRYLGLSMYPQFPVLNYYVDFGDPYKKVAIEVDGEQFHTNYKKELNRHHEIENAGWTLYHITGADAMRFSDEFSGLSSLTYDNFYYSEPYEKGWQDFDCYRDHIITNSSIGIVACIIAWHYSERKSLASYYLPNPMDYLIEEIKSRFYERCGKLKAAEARK